MQIVRYASLLAVPWKNGGGLTREILREPITGRFRWRLSMAEVASSGPFSDFSGYRRVMTLLEGHGVRLRIDGEARALRAVGEIIEFSGAARTDCELIDGPCVDLNLMVDESLPAPAIQMMGSAALSAGFTLRAPPAGGRLLVVLEGGISLGSGAGEVRLGRWDTALLEPDDGEVRLAALGASCRLLVAVLGASAPSQDSVLVGR
jgi:environmental stress-induced protein Ves